jgi:hypothetical protein
MEVAQDMGHLLLIRGDVLALLEKAREQKWVSLPYVSEPA